MDSATCPYGVVMLTYVVPSLIGQVWVCNVAVLRQAGWFCGSQALLWFYQTPVEIKLPKVAVPDQEHIIKQINQTVLANCTWGEPDSIHTKTIHSKWAALEMLFTSLTSEDDSLMTTLVQVITDV